MKTERILGTTPCIEPVYKHIHTKSNLSGDFIRTTDPLIRDLMALGLWDDTLRAELKAHDGSIQQLERIPADLKRLYKTAFEIAPTWILQGAAVRQKWIDQAQSTNLWLADNDARTASFVYREAWERGLKTTSLPRCACHRSGWGSGNSESTDQQRGSCLDLLSTEETARGRGMTRERCGVPPLGGGAVGFFRG